MSETFTADQVRDMLRLRCEKAGSIRAWARDNDVTHAYVAGVLTGADPPTRAVTHALGLKKIVARGRLTRFRNMPKN